MVPDAPAPGSHDRTTPTGTLEESSAALFEAMLAARDAEESGQSDAAALHGFYRALMSGTLLLPVPPDHGDEAKSALAAAINDDEEVEISVMLAADGDGKAISVCFASIAALSAWAPRGTASLPIPARIAIANMAAAGCRRSWTPPGRSLPLRARRAVGAGRRQAAGHRRAAVHRRRARSIRLRLPGPEAVALEASLADSLGGTDVDAAWLVESEIGRVTTAAARAARGEGAAATVDVPDGTDVVWLEEPLLASVRAVAEPFYRGAAGERRAARDARRCRGARDAGPPEVHNAFNAELIAELRDAFLALAARAGRAAPGSRAGRRRPVVLRRRRRGVATGRPGASPRRTTEADAARLQAMLVAIDECPAPVVARVHGAALGGGMGLCAVADIVLAADGTRFGFTETKLGIMPAVISPFVLGQDRGEPRASPLPERASASTPSGRGRSASCTRWCRTIAALDARVEAVVGELLSAGPNAARGAKAVIRDQRGLPRGEARALRVDARRAAARLGRGPGGPGRIPGEASAAWKSD